MDHENNVSVALPRVDLLGESPVWSAAEQALYWVDIKRPAVNRWVPATGTVRTWGMAEDIGSIALRRGGGLVAALRSGFACIDLASGAVEPIGNPIAGRPDLRFNDGRCDRQGRFWAGTVQEKRVRGLAELYRLEGDRSFRMMIPDLTVANGLSWSPDGRTMYYADSQTGEVFACEYDTETGAVANHRVFARFADDTGIPDGATVDADGFLWIAHFDGWRITRFAPDGRADRVVRMPVPRPTSCEFGGPGLRTLFVTSASFNLTKETLAAAPLSGSLFSLEPGVSGLPSTAYIG